MAINLDAVNVLAAVHWSTQLKICLSEVIAVLFHFAVFVKTYTLMCCTC